MLAHSSCLTRIMSTSSRLAVDEIGPQRHPQPGMGEPEFSELRRLRYDQRNSAKELTELRDLATRGVRESCAKKLFGSDAIGELSPTTSFVRARTSSILLGEIVWIRLPLLRAPRPSRTEPSCMAR